MNEEIKKEFLCHYTTIDVFCNMLKKYRECNQQTNCRYSQSLIFWASSIYTMNDPQEVRHGKTVLEELIPLNESLFEIPDKDRLDMSSIDCEKLLSDYQNSPFVISLSSNEDDLYMWNMYGDNGKGLTLKFNKEINVNPNYNIGKCELVEVCYTTGINNYPLLQQIYNEGSIKWNSCNDSDLSKQFKEKTLGKLFRYICPSIKSDSYEKEKEYRICVNDVPMHYVKFRTRNKTIIPYIEVPIPIKFLEEITLGPCCDSIITQKSLRYLLDSCGLQYIVIKESKISYRNN